MSLFEKKPVKLPCDGCVLGERCWPRSQKHEVDPCPLHPKTKEVLVARHGKRR